MATCVLQKPSCLSINQCQSDKLNESTLLNRKRRYEDIEHHVFENNSKTKIFEARKKEKSGKFDIFYVIFILPI